MQRNAKFDAALSGKVEKTGAPEELSLPPTLEAGLDVAWIDTTSGKDEVEHGGILVLTTDGRYAWRPGPPGTAGSFQPNYGDVQPGETLLAVGHTHPLWEPGAEGENSFSGADMTHMIYENVPAVLARSGTKNFMIVRTAAFNALVEQADTPDKKDALRQEMIDYRLGQKEAAAKAGAKPNEALHKANQMTAAKYHLLYYETSKGSDVKQSKPNVHVEAAKVPVQDETPAQGGAGKKRGWMKRLWGRVKGIFS